MASALSLFILGDAAQARVGGFTRAAYALTLIVVAAALVLTRNARGSTRALGDRLGLGVVVFGAFSALPALLEPSLSFSWFVGDLAGLLMVALSATFATRMRSDLQSFGGLLLVAGVLGSVLALGISTDLNRLEPPVVLSMTIGAYLTWGQRLRLTWRLVGVASSLLFLIATLDSGYRWSFAQVILIHLLIAGARLLRAGLLGVWAVSLVAVVVASSYLAIGGTVRTDNLTTESPTIRRIMQSYNGVDPSTDDRLADSADALAYLGQAGPLNWLVGFGHGAAYPVLTSKYLPEDDLGRFHAIHIGPVRVLFRYGLIGLVLHLVVGARIASWAVRKLVLRAGTAAAVLPVAALVLLLDFLVLNPLISAVDAAVLGSCWGLATIERVINRQPALGHPSSSWRL